jgi:prevent-host-death family protein
MKFAAIRDLQIKASDVVKKAEHEPVIITVHGKPKAVLTAIREEDLEDFLFENSPYLRSRIEKGIRDVKKGKVISHADLKARLESRVRSKRKSSR